MDLLTKNAQILFSVMLESMIVNEIVMIGNVKVSQCDFCMSWESDQSKRPKKSNQKICALSAVQIVNAILKNSVGMSQSRKRFLILHELQTDKSEWKEMGHHHETWVNNPKISAACICVKELRSTLNMKVTVPWEVFDLAMNVGDGPR